MRGMPHESVVQQWDCGTLANLARMKEVTKEHIPDAIAAAKKAVSAGGGEGLGKGRTCAHWQLGFYNYVDRIYSFFTLKLENLIFYSKNLIFDSKNLIFYSKKISFFTRK